jgi:hypothetical protein
MLIFLRSPWVRTVQSGRLRVNVWCNMKAILKIIHSTGKVKGRRNVYLSHRAQERKR